MRLGIPQPRFTQAPSGNSNAARCAICSRVNRCLAMPPAGITFSEMPLRGITDSFRLNDAMNENRGGHDVFGMDGADRNDFFDFGDGGPSGHGHDGIEISCRQAIRQIPQLIGGLRFDQCIVRVNRQFQNAPASFEGALFFSLGNFGADAHRGVETLQAGSGGAHALAQNALWHEFQRHFPGGEAFQKIIRVRPGKSGNHVPDLIVFEHDAKLAIARPAIVADGSDAFRAFSRQRLNEVIWKTRAPESSDHDSRAIGNVRHGFVEARAHFLLHHAPITSALRCCRKRASTPISRSHRPVSVPLKSFVSSARKSASSSTSISSRGLLRKITRAPMRSASPTCFAKLPMPKCDGNSAGGIRRMALVPIPSPDGTMTSAGSSHSTDSKSSMSLACTSGTSNGIRSSPVTPRSSQILDAASTESLSEICCSSSKISQPFSSAKCMAGS